ncbi:uncharacterized protein LOC132254761 [Vitis vinifera]|uniref:uncharacterized protein LOC132254761 n=1 Tax=Vitis vinifera TaxID=29760 RepID=UPI0028832911|nr:uncharacterized protein LOC132254761 [Vitis vinifera]
MGRRHRHVTDEDDEENLGGDDVYMYPVDMHPDERHAYREAVRASKAAEWNRQQEEHFIKGKIKTGSTIFLKSVDASNNIKDNKYIYGLLKDVIKEVGKQNVVQIVTDNGSAFVKAGKLLMKKYNLYWTSCAAHCIDLMFEDIDKRTSVADVITKARKITNFIYNHGWLLAQMRKVCGGDIVRPGATRFATNYIALDSLLKKKANLKKVFISDEWAQHNLSRTLIGKEVESLMFDHAYWERVGKLVSIYEALYTVLCIVNSEVVPIMPFVYKLIRVMKENLIRLNAKEWVLEIIVDRWDRTLKHPLHATSKYYLSLKFIGI